MRVRSIVLGILVLIASTAGAAKKFNAEAGQQLLAAAGEGEFDKIEAALKAGADPNIKDDQGRTPLLLASGQNLWGKEKETVAALKKAGAKIDLGDANGLTPLMNSAWSGRTEMTRALIAAGAKVDAKDKDGWTPLMYTAVVGEWSDTDELLKAKANLEFVDSDGFTALGIALNQGRGAVADRLFKAGAKLVPTTKTKIAPLIMSVYGRDLSCVRLVLENAPALDARDSDGWSALAISAFNDDRQIVMELLRAGVDPELEDKEGKTAIDRAKENENTETVALLSGQWDRPKLKGGTNIAVPCPVLGGNVDVNVAVDKSDLVFSTIYPKPLMWYLGGGYTNRAKSAKKYTYDGSIAPEITVGAYTLGYMEYGTSVTLYYKDSQGNERQKNVYGNVLSVDVTKGDEDVDTSNLENPPDANNENGVLETRVPLSLLGLKKGGSVKMGAKIGNCGPVSATVKLK